ncbi:plasmid replication protein, CyRepA1 family [Alkalinema pantanalense CENA528]|uniref:plasmid replication protein, CyRepA1 family n=1 Tax=Alkalinema pantanalense TaxID=1620705 RepID=UPI003D700D68
MQKNCIRSCGSRLESRGFLHSNSKNSAWDSAISRLGSAVASDHEQEWIASAVDPAIVRLNVETLTDTAVDRYSHEVSYPIAERLNWSVKRFGQQARTNLRGWWVSGIDPLNGWQKMQWGRFKPDADTPIIDREKGQPAKYLSPSLGKGSSRLTLLEVPFKVWQKVADRSGIAIAKADLKLGFWHWVWQKNVPVVLTEGEKKAGCLLTAGYAAIALPGIFGGYRREGNQLIPELEFFTQSGLPSSSDKSGRDFYICFDFETRPKVVQAISIAISKLGTLLNRAACTVKVITLPGPQKGVDDYVAECGVEEFAALCSNAETLDYWQAGRLWSLTHPPAVQLSQPYLGEINYPTTGLVCLKSPKGTGKTTSLQRLVRGAIADDRKVLVITHRIQLGRSICQSLGIDWITNLTNGTADGTEFHGYGLCIDSLHPLSQAHFDPQAWEGSIVILDEVEQVLWHALNSTTCYSHRVKILATLKELVQVVLSSGGLIVAQDADLSDISVDYLLSLTEMPIAPWLVVNDWQSKKKQHTYIYDTKNPAPLIAKMEQAIEQGSVFVCLDSQKAKSRWSSRNLETYLHQRFPEKRILRIDSETVASSDHPAYAIANDINRKIAQYDIVLATPTIGTGVSIDLQNHFQAVFGIFQGVMSDAESRQSLARVRDRVPRYVWSAKYGLGKIGNGSCFYRDIAQSTTKAVKYNVMLLKEVDFDLDRQTDPIALRTWSKMAARVNFSLWNFRGELQNGLRREGHNMVVVTDNADKILGATEEAVAYYELVSGKLQVPGFEFLPVNHNLEQIDRIAQRITEIRNHNQQADAEAISESPELSRQEYQAMRETRSRTTQQRHSQRKHELKSRYPISITPELTLKDEQGWHGQLRLHYYLIHDPLFVRLRDLQAWEDHLSRGNGNVSLQDVKLLTAQVEILKALGVVNLLDPDRKTRSTDLDVQEMHATILAHRQDIKLLFGLKITDRMAPITMIQALLNKLDVKLVCISRDRAPDGRRGGLRVYRYVPPTDDRETIFAQWQQQDEALLQAVTSSAKPASANSAE